MHKFHCNFRMFSLRGLLITGTVASLGLPLGRQACGIGGSAIQPTYTPRETITAIPSVTFIGATTSTMMVTSDSDRSVDASAQPSTPPGSESDSTRHISSDNEGNGTTAKRRRLRKASVTSGSTSVAKAKNPGYDSKDFKESKEIKNAIIAPPAKPILTLSTGFESRYIYHGVDIIGFNSFASSTGPNSGNTTAMTQNGLGNLASATKSVSPETFDVPKSNMTSPIAYANANFEFKGLHFEVGYVEATDSTIPQRISIDNEAAALNRIIYTTYHSQLPTQPPVPPTTATKSQLQAYKNQLQAYNNAVFIHQTAAFADTPNSSFHYDIARYKEVDINLDYSVSIIANVLDATVGYNSYIIPDHEFKGTNYQGEAFGRIAYKQIPYIQPSLTYYRYISDARASAPEPLNNSSFVTGPGPTPGTTTRYITAFTTVKQGEYLNGNYIEARLDAAVPLYHSSNVSLMFTPYALLSVDDGYLTKEVSDSTRLDLNDIEVGFKLPVTFKKHFVVTPYLNYGFDISSNHDDNDFKGTISPFKEDIWGGVTFSYVF